MGGKATIKERNPAKRPLGAKAMAAWAQAVTQGAKSLSTAETRRKSAKKSNGGGGGSRTQLGIENKGFI